MIRRDRRICFRLTTDEAVKYSPLLVNFWSKRWSDLIRQALRDYFTADEERRKKKRVESLMGKMSDELPSAEDITEFIGSVTASDNSVRQPDVVSSDKTSSKRKKPVKKAKKAKKPAKSAAK